MIGMPGVKPEYRKLASNKGQQKTTSYLTGSLMIKLDP